ncbi:MAG: phosphotriesterase-related protein [Gammaproteobacteria bacterium]|jgi:phosphotriesterase-related protein|nr:phosphotriesterase-related protein [Gammaproteobacteria bacterium]MBT4494749.1 phosphotriesterase-related protein [Gammaproteobacteria bacterium]MBT7369935.1 phosphotriesterase-related protein [Gammaproteobacteria bacterium]
MSSINSVLGTIENPGKTLIHEHILVGFPGWFLDTRQPGFKRDEALIRVCAAFEELKEHGVETVVDPCPNDLGRDVEFIAEVSSRTGINLICATGFYYEKAGIPYTLRYKEVDEIADIFINEIENGVGSTGIKPGLLKIATGEGVVSEYERKILTAAAKAAAATEIPVLSHTEKCSCGHDQIDIVTGEGVAPGHLLVGHSDGTDDLDYQRSLAERGVYVGFDRFGLEGQVTDEIRIQNLKQLVDLGYRQQIMMSHDYVNCWLGTVPGMSAGMSLSDVLPNWNMTHIFERIIPALKLEGMTDDDFDVILKDNPARFFSS